MPGGKLASEPVSLWQSASIEESGGFAGLRRGATIERRGVDDGLAARIDELLTAIRSRQAGAVSSHGQARQPMPDAQTLVLCVHTIQGEWTGAFDTADLPPEVSELTREFPPLRPLPLE